MFDDYDDLDSFTYNSDVIELLTPASDVLDSDGVCAWRYFYVVYTLGTDTKNVHGKLVLARSFLGAKKYFSTVVVPDAKVHAVADMTRTHETRCYL